MTKTHLHTSALPTVTTPQFPKKHHWLLFPLETTSCPAPPWCMECIIHPWFPVAAAQSYPAPVTGMPGCAWPGLGGAHRLITALPLTQVWAAVLSPWQCRHQLRFPFISRCLFTQNLKRFLL